MSPTDDRVQLEVQLHSETMQGQLEALADAWRKLGQTVVESFRPVVQWFNALPAAIRDAMARRAWMDPELREAVGQLDDALDDAEADLEGQLAEVRHWVDDVWAWALHHRLWAACTLGLTEADILDRGADILRHRVLLDWSADDAAAVVVGLLEGWAERLAFRELHPGAL